MSEQKPKSFMQELDQWTDDNVIAPLAESRSASEEPELMEVVAQIKRAIREKVLESYRSGKQAAQVKAEGRRPR